MKNPASIRHDMMADHARIERLLSDLNNAAEGASSNELIAVWTRFEAGLRAHIEFEEECLFPLVRDADLVARLALEHGEIRNSLDELGLAVELHAVRKENIDRFVEQLRTHAAGEDKWLYGYADTQLDEAKRPPVLKRLRALVREASTPERETQPRSS